MKIAIVGSGISGLTLWLFFQKLSLLDRTDVTIYEARPAAEQNAASEQNAETYNASVIGASIGISANGLKVLKRLDEALHHEVTKAGHVLATCKMTNARGWTLGEAPMGPKGETTLMIGREMFWQILRQRVPETAIIRKKVVKVNMADGLNSLVFSDGSKEEADLIVGADGIWSVVRRAIFDAPKGRGEYEYSPHYEGLIGVGGFVPRSFFVDDREGEMNVVFGANGFFGYSYTSPTNASTQGRIEQGVWWSTYSLEKCPEDWRKIDKQDAKKQLQARHSTWKNQTIQNIIRDVNVDSVYPTFTTPLLPTWERSGMVLVGDAAHALQPSSGQGASLAMEDCEALALFLDHYLKTNISDSHLMAVKQYCELRMPRVGMVHKKAQEIGALKQDMSMLQEMVMVSILPTICPIRVALLNSKKYFFIWMINRFQLGYSYNTKVYDYDGPTEVRESIQAMGDKNKTTMA